MSDVDICAVPNRNGLFGRSKGKQLRPLQKERLDFLLPNFIIDKDKLSSPLSHFSKKPEKIMMEIGFGSGEHVAAMAKSHPEIGFFAIEPFLNGFAKLLAAIDREKLENIRIFRGDAREIIQLMPDGCLDRIYLLYPDPWPKRRQRKRRIVDDKFLSEVARLLSKCGEFRFATDIDDYAGWTLARIDQEPKLIWNAQKSSDWKEPWLEWQQTRYEAKALREGRKPSYFRFVRV